MTTSNSPLRAIYFSPVRLGSVHTKFAAEMRRQDGFTFGVTSIDANRFWLKPRAGNVLSILGRPGHGKTSFSAYMAKHAAKQIVRHGDPQRQCVVYVTLEQTIEEMDTFFMANSDYSITDLMSGAADEVKVESHALDRANLPIWLIGETGLEDEPHPTLSVETIYSALEEMEKSYSVTPKLVVIDYLQIVPTKKGTSRVEQVTNAIIDSKALARRIRCPIVLNVQASREVDNYRGEQLPAAGDGQWASAIEQVSEKVLSLWRPILTMKPGASVTINKNPYPVTQDLLIVRFLKQRYGIAGKTFALHFSPQFAQLADWELNNHIPWEKDDSSD